MNEIAAKLGEVGLPEPVAELAARDWDAIVVGGGHNGLTAAAYLARAGRSVLVLERRERLGGACTLERPFADDGYVVSPCAYVVGLLDELVIRELELERRGLRYWIADPNLWVPFDDGTAFGQWLDDSRTQANLERAGRLEARHRGLLGLRGALRRGSQAGCARASATPGSATRPTRAEIEELLGGDRTMIDLVFEASIADVLDDHISDERLKTALFGQGIIGTWGGPRDPGTASIKLMHFQGDMDGRGPLWGYVEGGMGMVSFAIADAAREAGAVLACGVPVSEIVPGEGVTLEDGTTIRATTVISTPTRSGRWACSTATRSTPTTASGSSAGRCAARWSSSTPRSTGCRTGPRRPARTGRRARRSTSPAPSTRPSDAFEARRARRARGRLRRDLHPDRLRPEPAPRGQAPAERLRPVRALRARRAGLGLPPRRGRPAVHRADRPLRPGLRGAAWSTTRSSGRPTSSRGSG